MTKDKRFPPLKILDALDARDLFAVIVAWDAVEAERAKNRPATPPPIHLSSASRWADRDPPPLTPAEVDMRLAITSLSRPALMELIAVMWIGRGDYHAWAFVEAVSRADELSNGGEVSYVVAKGPLGKYLRDGYVNLLEHHREKWGAAADTGSASPEVAEASLALNRAIDSLIAQMAAPTDRHAMDFDQINQIAKLADDRRVGFHIPPFDGKSGPKPLDHDTAKKALIDAIAALTVAQQSELTATAWLGRGNWADTDGGEYPLSWDGEAATFLEIVAEAKHLVEARGIWHLVSVACLGKYLRDGVIERAMRAKWKSSVNVNALRREAMWIDNNVELLEQFQRNESPGVH